ncbi:hypothetical protein [Amycolatopsis sp. NPDC051903]|uniref:AMIN-like domain-containing (lipo)protein n=1 Tax=Amycolatopsis sp. NPDC051903 TaxID=3363936 RepID=UPI00378D872C
MRRTIAAATAAGLFALGACGSGTPGNTPVAPATETSPGTTTGSATATSPAMTGTTAPGNAGSTCGSRAWDTAAEEIAGSTTDAVYLVRVGRHECYDRVVLDINGLAETGYAVRYVTLVTADPSGPPLPVAGGAVLQVAVRAPALGTDDSGHRAVRTPAVTGDHLYSASQLARWPALRAVRFAGSFEGQCTFAIGVRSALPFRAFPQLDGTNQIRHVVVDIARRPPRRSPWNV